MWQHILALPLAAKAIALLAASLAVWAWVKHKAISTGSTALWEQVTNRFWSYIRGQIKAGEAPVSAAPSSTLAHQRSYSGIFQGYSQYANYPQENCFTIEHDGVTTKVPVFSTNLFSSARLRDFVEIDTIAGANYNAEFVQRVHIKRPRNG